MIRTALEFISEQAGKAEAPKVTTLPGRGDSAIVTFNGTKEQIAVAPDPRSYSADSLEGVIQQVNYLREIPGDPRPTMCVFVGENRIVGVVDEQGDRLDEVKMSLEKCEPFTTLEEGPIVGDQAALVHTLRTQFHGGVAPDGFIPAIRKLRFRSADDTTNEVQHARESMGAAIEREVVAGGEALPEEITLTCQVFEQIDLKAEVRCAFAIDFTNRELGIQPLAGEVDRAKRNVLLRAAGEIRKACDGVTVFDHSSC